MSDFAKFVQEQEESRERFWTVEYPKMSTDEKRQYWLASTHKNMRSMGESYADEYKAFSKKWYDNAKGREPEFDSIFKWVASNLGFKFDWRLYSRRIES